MAPRRCVIDTHAHIYPSIYLDRIELLGADAESTRVARNIGADTTAQDMAARIRMMDDAGVAVQVLSAVPHLPMVANAAQAATASRIVNNLYAKAARDYPGRFISYGALPLPHIKESILEARRCIDDLGFVGICITTLIRATDGQLLSPADPRFFPLYVELDRRKAILYLHATGNGACSSMINEHSLQRVTGAPVEDSTAVLQLLKADIPRRFPNMRIHVAHLGGDIPFLAQRIEDNYEDWNAFPCSPMEALKRMWFDAANFHAPSLRLTADTFGDDRIMCGSDFPYFQNEKYTRAVTYIRDAGLGDDATERILYGNARKLYGDKLPPPLDVNGGAFEAEAAADAAVDGATKDADKALDAEQAEQEFIVCVRAVDDADCRLW